MKTVAFLAFVVAATALTQDLYAPRFVQWKADFNVSFADDVEEKIRFEIFKDNVDKIEKHNKAYEAGDETYFLGLNQFAHMTQHEFGSKMNGAFANSRILGPEYIGEMAPEGTSVNWVTKGAVTNVKNQGQCGSCWAFSTCAGIEGTLQLAGKGLNSLAPQELVDCDKADGNQGCNGGFMDRATKWVISNGLCGWDDYRYTARDGSCKKDSCTAKGHISETHDVEKSESSFISALTVAPLSIGCDAEPWQFYSGGIFSKNCGTQIDHGILAAGFNDDYYLVKNSWGTSWGEEGYIRLSRTTNNGNECGILESAITSKA